MYFQHYDGNDKRTRDHDQALEVPVSPPSNEGTENCGSFSSNKKQNQLYNFPIMLLIC